MKAATMISTTGFPTKYWHCIDGFSIALRYEIMKRQGVLKITLILAGAQILTQCRLPTPVVAAVEFHLECVRMPISRSLMSCWQPSVKPKRR